MPYLIIAPGSAHETIKEINVFPFLIGRAPDCHLALQDESISGHHARIEQIANGFQLIDLESTNGSEVNQEPITTATLCHKDTLKLGEVELTFFLSADEAPEPVSKEPETNEPVHLPSAPVQQELVPHAGAPSGALSPYTQGGHYPGNPMPYQAPPPHPGAGILPLVAFIISLTIIGFPLGLILGFLSYSKMRQYGGTAQDHKFTQWALIVSTLSLFLFVGGVGYFTYQKKKTSAQETTEQLIARNESAIIKSLKNLVAAQKYSHIIEYKDQDNDGQGEYLTLVELAEVGTPFFDSNLADGEAYGYRIYMVEHTESHFTARAEPVDYGNTGYRTFSIHEDGRLRGQDLGAETYRQNQASLSVLQNEANALTGLDEELSQDVIRHTKSLAKNPTNMERIQRITQRVKTQFALTQSSRELQGISQTTDQFLIEQQAETQYREALEMLKQGETNSALAQYQNIVSNYVGYSRYAEVEQALFELRTAYRAQREQAARNLQSQADQLEREGQQQAAHTLYQKIERLYADTDTAQRISELKPEFQRQLRESNAEDLFFKLMELNPKTEYQNILSLANQLERNYEDTDTYDLQYTAIENHRRKARAQKWRAETKRDIERGRTRGALARLEGATEDFPDLQYDLKDLFIKLYNTVGKRLVEEGDPREALRIFQKLETLTQGDSEKADIPFELISQLHREVGFADMEKRDFNAARIHLSAAASKDEPDANLQLNLGIANLYSGEYTPAHRAFSRAIELNPDTPQAYIYRSYLNMRYLLYAEPIIASVFLKVTTEEPSGVDMDDGFREASSNPTNNQEQAQNQDNQENRNNIDSLADFDQLYEELETLYEREITLPYYDKVFSSPVPDPRDRSLNIQYRFNVSKQLLPASIALVRKLNISKTEFAQSIDASKGEGRGQSEDQQMEVYILINQYRKRISTMRTFLIRDREERDTLLQEIRKSIGLMQQAEQDLKEAAKRKPEWLETAKRSALALKKKREEMQTSFNYFRQDLEAVTKLQDEAMFIADQLMKELQQEVRTGTDALLAIKNLTRQAGEANFDRGLVALEKALTEKVEVEDLLYLVDQQAASEQQEEERSNDWW